MSHTHTGLVAGLLLAVAIATGGFTGFLLALVLGGVGLVVGAQLDGRVDVNDFLPSHRE
ncbi:DUF2273 domain-containing protein [Aeromicrobium sp. CF4.19]|uniref:DUF2273 domain-containing protein n=1 Tax=Aeromicrobium sp. CF4.19 TaxID=3373082 RepID=UPI003EE4CD49